MSSHPPSSYGLGRRLRRLERLAALLGVRTALWLQEARLAVVAASPAAALARQQGWAQAPMGVVASTATGPSCPRRHVTALLADRDEAPSPSLTSEAVLQQALWRRVTSTVRSMHAVVALGVS
ncbi:hypothetical protein CHLRE_06g300966v5 [Chlamydomonas reinhardtii]|uniref:Uncharacterized protein n=1 Tax=Chlamydomonas reinhardtii TaxID=3055 RepID=A0A2K3DQX9_CHLRE|nr:uncharacterized protein CHLRE_06g300966v5 [Chlamydomonas reinhardtii]PNW82953.1 hypothetical protein CHLRE_06g300966v5 [Chlamydomonas reinhardtii]